MAIALRPFASSASMVSRYGSQALAEGLRLGSRGGFSASGSVDTSMAGFEGLRPHPPGECTAIPAARRYAPAVSGRMCAALSMRRNDHPSRPSAMTCCFFSSLKTLLT
jgi:hypothetical protein